MTKNLPTHTAEEISDILRKDAEELKLSTRDKLLKELRVAEQAYIHAQMRLDKYDRDAARSWRVWCNGYSERDEGW